MAFKVRTVGAVGAALLGVLAIGGCVSPAERDANACRSYGWTPGTDGFAQCMQSVDMQRRQLLNSYLLTHAAQPAPYQVPYPSPQIQQPVRLQTTCQRIGAFTYCN